MVVATKNSVFIHFPKNAGRWISETIIKNVKGSYYIGDPTYNAHDLPCEINGKKVFICVREPSTWLHSLWHHRARKKGLLGMRRFNWQNNFILEKKCKSRNFDKFIDKAITLDNPVFEYYSKFIPNVDELYLIYFENLTKSLISFLEFCGEDYDEIGIIESSRFPVNTTNRVNKLNKQNDFKLDKQRLNKLFKNNKKFFELTDYKYQSGLLEIPKTFKKITKEELNIYDHKYTKNKLNEFIGKKYIHSPKTFLQKEIFALSSNIFKETIDPLRNFFRKISFKTFCLFLKIYINLRYKPSQFQIERGDSSLCIEFGGGSSPLKRDQGFLNIDLKNLDTVDMVCKAEGILKKLNPNTVELIFSRHFLEYLTEEELYKHLEDCQILLKSDGILECIIPSTEYHILQLIFSKPGSTVFKNAFDGFNGCQRGNDRGYRDLYKSNFTYSSIEHILLSYGFSVQFKKTAIKNIHFLATPNRKLFY